MPAPIYSVELTGESTLVTVRLGGETIVVCADKDFAGEIDADVNIRIDPAKTYLFDARSEQRIRV